MMLCQVKRLIHPKRNFNANHDHRNISIKTNPINFKINTNIRKLHTIRISKMNNETP